jgi:hypothetical protein
MSLAAQLARAVDFDAASFVPWIADEERIGWLLPETARILAEFGDVFRGSGTALALLPRGVQARTEALERVARELARRGLLTAWRDERYAVASPSRGVRLFDLERSAMRRLGLRMRAVQLNGIVRSAGRARMWVARRSPAKSIDPGKLDNLVGGGIASGMDARGTLLKECDEEAGIPTPFAACATPGGRLRIRRRVEEGLHDEELVVFDLELGADFAPANRDGEVSGFALLETPELVARLSAGEFTVDAGAVAIDWLARQGLAPGEPALPERLAQLREPDPG